ncbi:MAG: YbaB/EbfC family nucleoid-associated protein [Mycobacteriaceae bacterium]|nr:YbaB/EbfC family nucleoid-associated protein [Mycobacteriaceae bacterium]
MITWFIDKLVERLCPQLEELVRAAVNEAVSTAADEMRETLGGAVAGLDALSQQIIDNLKVFLPKLKWPL